jgi:RNA recognition motif-containing protein
MRNKKGKDEHGRSILGKSKGFGFVEFSEHLDALTCLRNLNNNPSIFTDKKV